MVFDSSITWPISERVSSRFDDLPGFVATGRAFWDLDRHRQSLLISEFFQFTRARQPEAETKAIGRPVASLEIRKISHLTELGSLLAPNISLNVDSLLYRVSLLLPPRAAKRWEDFMIR
jgi:hypothetical protein